MIKKLAVGSMLMIVLVLAPALLPGCGGSSTSLPANAAAKVGPTVITQDQFNAELAVYKGLFAAQVPDETKNPDKYRDFKASVLDHMVSYEVAKQKAASLNVSLTDQEVQDHIAAVRKNSFGDDQAKMDAALKQANVTMEQLQSYYRELMLVQKVYEEVTKGDQGVTDAEVSAYYDAHKSSFYQKETRTVRHILISPKGTETSDSSSTSTTSATPTTASGTEAEWAAALATAQKVRADLVGGADWKTEAAQYSDDPATKDKGGEIGTISKGMMVAPFDDAVFTLAKDELSQPVKTVYGYHILQVTAINPAKQQTLDEVKSKITTTLLSAKKKVTWNEWLTKTKAELGVVIEQGMEITTTTAGQTTTTTKP